MQNIKSLLENDNFLNNQNYVNSKLYKVNPFFNTILWGGLLDVISNWYCYYNYDRNNSVILALYFYGAILFLILMVIIERILPSIMGFWEITSYSTIFLRILWMLIFITLFMPTIAFIIFKMLWYSPFKIKVFIHIYRGVKIIICKL